MTLGGEGSESRVVEDPNAPSEGQLYPLDVKVPN